MSAQNIQTFDLPSVLDVDAMDELREWLGSALEIGDVQINGNGVTRVVTNALLMFASANKTAEQNSFSFGVHDASVALKEAVERLGMGQIISPLLKGN